MKEYDLVIVGAGSGNMIPGPEHDDWQIAIVEKNHFGGTCLNNGCIPSKMLLQSAQVADTVNGARKFGIDATLNEIDWKRVTSRVWDRIDPISAGGEQWRGNQPNTTVYKGEGRFVAPKIIEVNGEQITGRQIVVGAGSRPFIPPIPGLDEVPYHTSDTIMRLPEQPRSIIIVGGGYIGVEMAHFFGGLGTEVTLIESSDKLIRVEDDDICIRFTEIFGRHNNLLLNSTATAVGPREGGDGVSVDVTVDGEARTVSADTLLLAVGRTPNSDRIDAVKGGLDVAGNGKIVTDEFLRTNIEGVWALGDITSPLPLKHFANMEARTVKHNLSNPDHPIKANYAGGAYAVFSSPQLASVGLTERDVHDQGIPHIVGKQDYAATAYGWATEDTESFVKIIAHAQNRRILGAHIIGPQASILIQPLINAYELGNMNRPGFYGDSLC